MKTFRQFIKEQQQEAEPWNSRGVLRVGNKIFVGVQHGVAPTFEPKIEAEIQNNMAQNGYYHEGNGGDAKALKNITKNQPYNGSWDDLHETQRFTDPKTRLKISPYYHMNRFFGNSPEGTASNIKDLTNENSSIRDVMYSVGRPLIFPDKKRGSSMAKDEMNKFWDLADDKTKEFGNLPATKENLQAFVNHGAKQIWDGNDIKRDTPMGQMAYQDQNTDREGWLLSKKAPAGVYYIGSGHIPSMVNTLTNANLPHNLTGGSHAAK